MKKDNCKNFKLLFSIFNTPRGVRKLTFNTTTSREEQAAKTPLRTLACEMTTFISLRVLRFLQLLKARGPIRIGRSLGLYRSISIACHSSWIHNLTIFYPSSNQRISTYKKVVVVANIITALKLIGRRNAQHERADNNALEAEKDKIRCENIAIRESLKHAICPNCGGPPVNACLFPVKLMIFFLNPI
ncbi:hypothetical protein HID58_035810 [Brassica napus]|uniref:Uncharacterized protein n=1 Tax=Brassica napus TaxID=3708 RepID=A0ABQ8C5Y1_BRANA|nr:hypothetical protein HID58_035810 [Brassica napus]